MLSLDAPLLVVVLPREVSNASAQRWMGAQDVERLSVSDRVVTQFSSALAIKLRTEQLDAGQRAAAMAAFQSRVAVRFRLSPENRTTFRLAVRFVDLPMLNLRSGDALHLAICAEQGAVMCPFDRRLAEAAPLVGIEAECP